MRRPPSKRSGRHRRSSGATISTVRERPPAELVEAMIGVARYRFGVFRRAFGRNPKPNEPLFFVEGLSVPTLAESDQVAKQLSEAALATGVDVEQLKQWLNLR